MAKVMILGAGSFGTALAVMSHAAGNQVTLWSYNPEEADEIRQSGENKRLLPGVKVSPEVTVTSDLSLAREAEVVIIATPSHAVRSVSRQVAGHLAPKAVVVCVSKGLEPETLLRNSQVIAQEIPQNPCVVLSGPSHAEEIAKGVPTTLVAASTVRAAAEEVQDIFGTEHLRIYVSDDVVGVELGGALKNVIALAAGVLDGLKMGDNSKAALMTRGLTEIARLGVACGAKTETFAGLSGMGDLIVTCTSMHSRNRRAGILIGSGVEPGAAVAQIGMVVEGFASTKAAHQMSQKMGVEMPITCELYNVLYEQKNLGDALRDLMGRPKRHESEVIWLLTGR